MMGSSMAARLPQVLAALERAYGEPALPATRTAFEMVLWECVAYLVEDERRAAVFNALRRKTGCAPERIGALSARQLGELLAGGGILPAQRVRKVFEAAALAAEIGPATLEEAVARDEKAARKLLRKFPGIGEPGAEKILMTLGGLATLAPESNGLRVLTRLGLGEESTSYARTYRSAARAVAADLPAAPAARVRAHHLLRLHGQRCCKRTAPHCSECPLARICPSANTP
jgi:endonuclease III